MNFAKLNRLPVFAGSRFSFLSVKALWSVEFCAHGFKRAFGVALGQGLDLLIIGDNQGKLVSIFMDPRFAIQTGFRNQAVLDHIADLRVHFWLFPFAGEWLRG